LQESGVVLPLDELIKSRDSVYEKTCAAIKRAVQINLAGDEELVDNKGKIVSTAIKQILSNKVQYRLED
jgi:DNA-directed RNA polymerase subunit omega